MKHDWLAPTRPLARCVAPLALLLAACAAQPGGPQNDYTGHEGAVGLEERIENDELSKHVELTNIRSERRSDRLVVQFELASSLPSTVKVEWMVRWFDPSGVLVDVPIHWEPVTIGPGGSLVQSMTAPTPHANTWRLSIRPRNEIK